MSMMAFHCDDKETLVAYLYDEVDWDARREVAAHLRTCAACASELATLQGVRTDLSEWQPPMPQLDFAIVQQPGRVLRPASWSIGALPAWARVAAAVLVVGIGAGIANLQIRYGQDGLSISTGWMSPAVVGPGFSPAESARLTPRPTTADQGDWRPALTALEYDLRRELQLARSTPRETPAGTASGSVDGNALLRRVQTLINESEQRQRDELALRMTQFGRDVELQRRADYVRFNQIFGELGDRTGALQEYQRELTNMVRRVTTQQIP